MSSERKTVRRGKAKLSDLQKVVTGMQLWSAAGGSNNLNSIKFSFKTEYGEG
ncbi:hypothetical protein AFLA70_39g003931 [Aspergillus flavus AF70]|nr:hypothetical protein AFLA70_39g003931 [Aspergillus flavus AF70]